MIKKISRKAPLFMAACMAFALVLAGCGGTGSPAGNGGGGFPSDTGPTPITFTPTEPGLWQIDGPGSPRLVPDIEERFSYAIAYISANEGTFVFAVDADVTSIPLGSEHTLILSGDNRNLTIIGMGGTRVLNRGAAGRIIFTQDTATNSSVTLRNITLRGQATGNTMPIVDVGGGWRFVMEGNSRIEGTVSTGAGNQTLHAYGAAVRIAGGSRLYMRSGQITGNRSSSTTANAAGGVSLQGATSRIVMLGGTITGNSHGPSATDNTPRDIRINGNAQIYGPTGSSVIDR